MVEQSNRKRSTYKCWSEERLDLVREGVHEAARSQIEAQGNENAVVEEEQHIEKKEERADACYPRCFE